MESVNKYISIATDKNKTIGLVFSMLLVLYAAMAAPKLPKKVAQVFKNPIVKLVCMFLIAYLATDNPSVSLIMAVALLITIQSLSSLEVADDATSKISNLFLFREKTMPTEVETEKTSEIPTEVPIEAPLIVSLPEIKIPLSPERVEFINEAINKAQEINKELNVAQSEGNSEKANVLAEEIIKQEIKIDAAIKAKEHEVAAEEAQSKGLNDVADKLIEKANDQVAKVQSLVIAEVLKEAAVEAAKNGDLETAQVHAEEAAKEEEKVISILEKEREPEVEEETPVVIEEPVVVEAPVVKQVIVSDIPGAFDEHEDRPLALYETSLVNNQNNVGMLVNQEGVRTVEVQGYSYFEPEYAPC